MAAKRCSLFAPTRASDNNHAKTDPNVIGATPLHSRRCIISIGKKKRWQKNELATKGWFGSRALALYKMNAMSSPCLQDAPSPMSVKGRVVRLARQSGHTSLREAKWERPKSFARTSSSHFTKRSATRQRVPSLSRATSLPSTTPEPSAIKSSIKRCHYKVSSPPPERRTYEAQRNFVSFASPRPTREEQLTQ